jgi:hypothetical protein
MARRPGRLRRLLPPVAMVFGLFLFGIALVQLGSQASPQQARVLHPGSLTMANGTAVLVYPVNYFAYRQDHIEVSYSFPEAPGDAYFVDCPGAAALAKGRLPQAPLLTFVGQRTGTFVVSYQTLPPIESYLTYDVELNRPCDAAVALVWAATTDPGQNKPDVAVLYYEAGLGGEDFVLLAMLMGGSALVTLLGGLAWARMGHTPTQVPPSDGSTVEALRAALDQVVAQLERTRKNLLFAGILGVFLWYPFLVPWSWQQAMRASDDETIALAVAGLTLAFLLALTILWAREFLRLDRHLTAWRGRLGELRTREDDLLESLEHSGG